MARALTAAALCVGSAAALRATVRPAVAGGGPLPPGPTDEQLRWLDSEFACFIHYNIATMKHLSSGCNPGDVVDISVWDPRGVNTTQWIDTGKAMGCTRFVYTAKHACGFLAWNSTVSLASGYNYSVASITDPAKAVDVAASFVASAKAAGVQYGFYYSSAENTFANVWNNQVSGSVLPGTLNVTQEQYDMLVVAHLTVWFDGGYNPSLTPALRALFAALQPHVVAFQGDGLSPSPIRWMGSESGYAPDPMWCTADGPLVPGQGNPNTDYWAPAETDFTLQANDQWYWNPDVGVRAPAELRAMYEASVGHNTAIIVDIAPQPDGTVPADQQQAAALLGAYVRGCYQAAPVANVSGSGTLLMLPIPSPSQFIDRIVIREDLFAARQQRVWAYTVTGTLAAGGGVVPVSNGTSVGNKKIDVLGAPVSGLVSLTLNVTMLSPRAGGPPLIREFAARSCSKLAGTLDAEWAAWGQQLHTQQRAW